MSKIYDLFYDLKHNSANYLNAQNGKAFEERLMVQMHNIGFNRILKHDLDKNFFKEHKHRILHTDEIVTNQTEFRQHYLHEPFGSQAYPDFIMMDMNLLICIESKFTEKKQKIPVWNSGLPRLNGLYVFGSYGYQDLTFFRGYDVISFEERQKLLTFFNEEKNRAREFNEKFMSNQSFGFAAYVRTAYEQKQVFNSSAIINFFENDRRPMLEDSVLTYLKSI